MDKRTELLIEVLNNKLTKTDYKEFKNIRGEYTKEEWEVISKERQQLRDEINKLRESE